MSGNLHEAAEQLRREHDVNREKRIYFLLTGSGAALAFATTQITNGMVGWTIWLIVLSLALTGSSFFFGMMILSLEARLIASSRRYVETLPKVIAAAQDAQSFRDHVEKVTFNPLNRRLKRLMAAQLWFLFFGAMLLPIWKLAQCDECLKSLAIISTQKVTP